MRARDLLDDILKIAQRIDPESGDQLRQITSSLEALICYPAPEDPRTIRDSLKSIHEKLDALDAKIEPPRRPLPDLI